MAESDEGGPPPPMVSAVEEAFVRAHERNVATSTAAHDESLTKWLEAFEAEHAGVLQRVLGEVLARPETPPMLRDVLGPITDPVHQTQVLLGLVSVGSIVSQFVGAAIAPEVQAVSNVAWSLNADAPLSPSDMALAVLRGNTDHDSAVKESLLSGLNAERFALMVLNTGEPPGTDQLAEAFRRGFISQAEFEKGVKESRVRDEWFPTLLALRYSPIAPGDAVGAAVQGYLTMDELADRLSLAGIDPVNTELLYESHGRPPGVQEYAELVNRGEASVDQLEQAIRESDIKDKYINQLVLLRRKIPPMKSIVSAIHQGVLSEADGITKLMNLGYDAADAAMFAKEGSAQKHAGTKALSQGAIHNLYAERLITRPAAVTMLSDLGYDATEVAFILELADHERTMKAQTTAVARVHSRYIAYHTTRPQALIALDQIGIDPTGRDDLIGAWDDERAINAPRLTLADLHGLMHRGLIGQTEFADKLTELGYAAVDIPYLYALSYPPTKPGPKWEL